MFRTLLLISLALVFASTLGEPLWDRRSATVVANGTRIFNDGSKLRFEDPSGAITHKEINQGSIHNKRDSGWIASVWTYSTFDYYYAVWNVPCIPSTPTGQILFFFNSFENSAYNDILQPVLQYNNGVSGWTLASWYGVDGYYYESTPVSVNVGDVITGIIWLYDGTWYILGYVNGVFETELTVSYATAGAQANAEFAMEVYYVTECSQYPPTNVLSVRDIYLENGSTQITPSWSTDVYSNSCNAGASGDTTTATITWTA
jgi:hypothetical protein